MLLAVSIPYRQASNSEDALRQLTDDKFQFLIGKLVTKTQKQEAYLFETFQFLIGKLVTRRIVL